MMRDGVIYLDKETTNWDFEAHSKNANLKQIQDMIKGKIKKISNLKHKEE